MEGITAKEFLKKLGFSAVELGEIMGYSRGHIYRLVSGNDTPITGWRSDQLARWHTAIETVKQRIEDEYHRDLEALNAHYSQRREAVEALMREHAPNRRASE